MSLPRTSRIAASLNPSRSRPARRIAPDTMRPGGEGTRRSTDSAVTLLPQPDSPTIARVSPGMTWNETPSTARTTPSRVKNQVLRSAISRSGLGAAAAARLAAPKALIAGNASAYAAMARGLARGEEDAAHQARHPRHLGDGDREDDVLDAGAGQRHQRDRDQDRGDRHQPVHDPHDDRIDPAGEPGDDPDQEAEPGAERGDADPDDQRHAGAVDRPAVDVAAQHVGAEPIGGRGPFQPDDRRRGLPCDGAEKGREHRHRG